jgi:signal transduction histidine kinase
MRVSLKTKQVAGVTVLVGIAVIGVSVIHLASFMRVSLEESRSRGELLANAIFQRARDVVVGPGDPYELLRTDPGIRSLLQSSIAYSKNVTYAAIVDASGVAIAHAFPSQEGRLVPPQDNLAALLEETAFAQFEAIYDAKTFEIRQPVVMNTPELGSKEFGSIRIGVSTLLIQNDLAEALRPVLVAAGTTLLVTTLVAMLLSQLMLRPIHVIKSGLSRLGRGEFDVKLDLPPGDEFGELGTSFNTISARLSKIREAPGEAASLQSVVEHLEDAVAIFNADGELLFANPGMRAVLPESPTGSPIDDLLAEHHPYRRLVEETLATRTPQGPVAEEMPVESEGSEPDPVERLVLTHPIADAERRFVGVLLVARNLSYLSEVQTTLAYSRKLAALGRLLAGVAHEVKNPLNAMTIHLELLKQKLLGSPRRAARPAFGERPMLAAVNEGVTRDAAAAIPGSAPGPQPVDVPAVMKHVGIIADEIRRLDQVVQGFLKFMRPEELKLQPVDVSDLFEDVVRVVEAEAEKSGVTVVTDCPPDVNSIRGDPAMLKQALLNLALNACQAMPSGGTLTLEARPAGGRIRVDVEDTGVGIEPEHLEKIFDLYFTTKEHGSGIGLSMVYRTVQLHDGEIEVQSTPGRGTTFRLMLPRAAA